MEFEVQGEGFILGGEKFFLARGISVLFVAGVLQHNTMLQVEKVVWEEAEEEEAVQLFGSATWHLFIQAVQTTIIIMIPRSGDLMRC